MNEPEPGPPQARAATDAGREAAQRRQAVLDEPGPAPADPDSDDLARLDETLTRLEDQGAGMSGNGDAQKPAFPAFDRRLPNPGLPTRQA